MTRRLATGAFLIALFGLVIAAIAGSSGGLGDASAGSLSIAGRSFTGQVVQDGGGAKVAVVPIQGVIVNGDNAPGGGATGGDDTVALIRAIRESGDFDGLILEVNSPGGAVLASAEIAAEVRRAQDDGLKVVSWMRDTAASGGYYVSAPADRIVAAPTTVTGSIGVILEYLQVAGLASKVGVKPVVIKSGALKDMGSPFRDLTPDEMKVLSTMINEAYGDFVTEVAEGRDMSEDAVRAIADGRIYTGRQAAQNGLVDEIGLRATAFDEMADLTGGDGSDLRVVRFERSFGFAELLTASSNRSLAAGETAKLAGDVVSALATGERVPLGGVAAGSGHTPMLTLEYRAAL